MRLGTIVVAGLLYALCGGLARAEPVKIRIAWITIGNPPPILEAKKDLAKHWGQSYEIEPVHFQGTPPIMTALAAGELEIANLSFPSLGNAILNAKLDDLRVIGDEGQDGVPGYHSIEYLVLKDGPIKTVEDLKGKVLATNIIGSATDIGVRVMLKRHGLLATRDYTVIEGAFPNMPSLLLQQKADLVDGVPPFSLDPKFRAEARTLFTQKDAMGKSQLAVWTARAPFIANNRAALVDFFADYLRIMRWYLDPANRPQMLQIVAGVFKVPVDRVAQSTYNENDVYFDRNGLPDMKALQSDVDAAADLGFLKQRIDLAKYTDLSIMQDALKRVGTLK
ncbi:MAG TPA: ABC transporter substrate-binding protein [Stellaceae bacterium]|nr:ABC transporter substrate-binding protein [Stellaceae bacterium]